MLVSLKHLNIKSEINIKLADVNLALKFPAVLPPNFLCYKREDARNLVQNTNMSLSWMVTGFSMLITNDQFI